MTKHNYRTPVGAAFGSPHDPIYTVRYNGPPKAAPTRYQGYGELCVYPEFKHVPVMGRNNSELKSALPEERTVYAEIRLRISLFS